MKHHSLSICLAGLSLCAISSGAIARSITESADPATFSPDLNDTTVSLGDLIFDGGFDGQLNGGTSCETATALSDDLTYAADTVSAPNWMSSFGPLFSPSNDVVYEFVAGPDVSGSITPVGATYSFAMYLIPSCADSGPEPTPIGATATVGVGIDLAASGVISGNTYYLAVTGATFGGSSANGFVTFTTPAALTIAPRF